MAARDRFSGQFPAVLDAARTGDPDALGRIFTVLSPVVVGYLRLQGATEPEDLASEVFIGVMRNIDRFEGDEAAFRSWVFTIAHRRVLDDRRHRSRRPTHEQLDQAPEPVAPDDLDETLIVTLGDEWVTALCGRISADQRDVVLLRLLGDLTVDEVALALGKSQGAVKQLQRRGFNAIGRLLEREGVPR